jgi:allantoate deiminase
LLAYAEVHIEQGPVLEANRVGLGVVTGIAGQTRVHLGFAGRAGHAGTTPMNLRRDALCAAAEFILAVESAGLTATVGRIEAQPGASNVIPAQVTLSLDVRHANDPDRRAGVARLRAKALAIAKKRRTPLHWTLVQETGSIACDPRLTQIMVSAAQVYEPAAPALASGAGHDAAALAAVCPVAMLFVRCKGGLSHHPAESMRAADAAKAIGALREFILRLADEVLSI